MEEDREKEGPADGEWDVDATTAPPDALGSDPVEARRELSRHLRASAFPASRGALVEEAESQRAPANVIDALSRLPGGEEFATVHEVWAVLEGLPNPHEAARTDPVTDADR